MKMGQNFLIYCLPLVNILRLSEVICLTQDFYLLEVHINSVL